MTGSLRQRIGRWLCAHGRHHWIGTDTLLPRTINEPKHHLCICTRGCGAEAFEFELDTRDWVNAMARYADVLHARRQADLAARAARYRRGA